MAERIADTDTWGVGAGVEAEPPDDDTKETGRVEAFSDGVFAIAITLLVLDLHLPAASDPRSDGEVYAQLLSLWPQYLAFVISFAFIGIMWINHHRLFTLIRRTNTVLMLLNLLLLFGVTVLPFPTDVLAERLGRPGETAASVVYGSLFVVIAVVFNVLWRYAAGGSRLLGSSASPEAVRKITRQYALGPLMYIAALLLAFVDARLFLAAQVILAIFFALPGRPARSLQGQSE